METGRFLFDELMAWFDQHPDSDGPIFTLLNEVRAPLVPRIHVRGADLFERGRLLTRPRASMPLILLHPSMARLKNGSRKASKACRR